MVDPSLHSRPEALAQPGPTRSGASLPWRRPPRAIVAGLLAITLSAASNGAFADTKIQLHGLLDVVAAQRGHAYDLNLLTRGDSPLDAYGLRLFADATVNDRLQVFTQAVLRDATDPYVDGAYLTFTPMPGRDLHVQAGKVPWSIGTYAPRTYSNKNPLVGAPLMYQYHSTLLWYELAPSADDLLAKGGTGQYEDTRGMPILDDSYWDVGVTVLGSVPSIEYSISAMAGTPGWGSTAQDENAGKSVMGRVGFMPMPGLRVGVSGATGPYLIEALDAGLPAGSGVADYDQKLGMADLELQAGHVELRAEAAYNVWETPTVGDLEARSGYAELKYSFPIGAYVAGRYDVLRFGEITDSTGAQRPWDANMTRYEVGAGFRFTRDALAKVVYQQNVLETNTTVPTYIRPHLIAAQVSVAF